MVEKNGTLSKKSRLGEAFSYVLNQWDALCYYSDDGLAEADNNAAERALRAVCLGKKNFMFFGSDHGGERGALLYGLIGTCRLNGIDPEAYLRLILSVLPEWRKRTARAILTGMCYSAGSAMRHGSSSLTQLTGQSAMTPSTWRR